MANLSGVKAGDMVIRTGRCGPNTFEKDEVVTKVGRLFAYVGKTRFYISDGVESSDRFGADVLSPKETVPMSDACRISQQPLNCVESAAAEAAMKRAQTGQPVPLGPDPAIHSADSELTGVARVLRHRLRLDFLNRPVVIQTMHDSARPLLMNGKHYSAVNLSIPSEDGALNFLVTYNDLRRLTFDIVAPCPRCHEPVPSEEINSTEDLGDFLLQARDALGGSPRFRYSPAHAVDCIALGD